MYPTCVFTALAALVLSRSPSEALAAEDDSKVKVELYYESQCPGCRDMITRSFKEAFSTTGFLNMATVSFYPYGNAKETGDSAPYTFECQHGPSECQYNLIETCALKKISCPYKQFKFINCIENNDEDREPDQDYDNTLHSCAALTGNKDVAGRIETCYKGKEGNHLEHKVATKTGALDPPHKYVPWVVANGVHDDDVQKEITESLLAYVCSVYDGPNKSPACPEVTALRTTSGPEVCNRDAVVFEFQ